MSVLPLSAKERIDEASSPEGTVPYGSGTSEVVRDDTGPAIDKHINAALDRHYREDTADEPRSTHKGIDAHLHENLESYYQGQEEKAAFDASKDSRSELQRRYAAQGGDIAETLSRFIGFHKAALTDPRGASLSLAESYARLSPYSLTDKPAAEKAETYVDAYGTRHGGKKLSAIIEGAIETATSEKKDFVATAQQRAELKSAFPDLTFAQAVDRILQIDTDLRKSPIDTAAQIAAAYGMPWSPRQEANEAEHNRVVGMVNASGLPGIEHSTVQAEVTAVLRRPDFQRSGNYAVDLQRAYRVAEHQYNVNGAVEDWARSELSKMDPQLARVVEHTLYNDPAYKAQAAQVIASRPHGDLDPDLMQTNFRIATAIARQKMASVSKAKRAGRVRSSTGSNPRGSESGGSGLERAIANAMRSWSDD